jgi:hypothetical protein
LKKQQKAQKCQKKKWANALERNRVRLPDVD